MVSGTIKTVGVTGYLTIDSLLTASGATAGAGQLGLVFSVSGGSGGGLPPESDLEIVPRRDMTSRTVLDKNGNPVKIWGQSKSSSQTTGHAEAMEALAEEMAKSGEYAYVVIQRSWRTATGREVASRNIPDVIGVKKDGMIDAFEIISDSDTPGDLVRRLESVMDTLGWRKGKGEVKFPSELLGQ